MSKIHKTKRINVYLYTNEHVVIPRGGKFRTGDTGVYGSTKKTIEVKDDNTTYNLGFHVRKNILRAIDNPGIILRCQNNGIREIAGRCVVKYLEDLANCTTYQLMANKTKEFCSRGQLTKSKDTYHRLLEMSEAELIHRTGCLPDCNRYEMTLEDLAFRKWPSLENSINKASNTTDPIMILRFFFEDGHYSVREEYIVYDTSNFIADVGGYLGLLVGQSILSIYYWSAECLPIFFSTISSSLRRCLR